MTYKEKFEASEHRAHYQNIATKILREMNDLRSKAQDSPLVPRRWIWELIQNAKDVYYPSGVDIQVNFSEKAGEEVIIFKHNGRPFNADNIRFLIEQISTKDRSKDEEGKRKNTGKFGTGFLSTHLLSEIVTVKGIAKEPELEYTKFELILDRSGFELEEITDAVQRAKDSILNLDELDAYSDYNAADFNTSFRYPLNDSLSISIAKAGLNDLNKCLPYALLFVDEIKTVQLPFKNLTYYRPEKNDTDGQVEIVSVCLDYADELLVTELQFAKLRKGFTSIVVPVKKTDTGIEILPIDSGIPKLFCDFPLIGTEIFPFPVIINNPNFNPTDPRDGIFLNSTQQKANPLADENKTIVEKARDLYFVLLDNAIQQKWKNLHYLANIFSIKDSPTWLNAAWFSDSVLKLVRKKILYANIVRTASGELKAILNSEGKPFIWFPFQSKKEDRERAWNLASEWFPQQLPHKDDIELWHKLAWSECGKLTLDTFAGFVQYHKKIATLQLALTKSIATDWLNQFYSLLQSDEKEYHSIIDKREIIPDQNGDFWKKEPLYCDAGDIDEEFKDILNELGNDIRAKLMNSEVEIDLGENRIINQAYIVKEIVSEVSQKTENREIADKYRTGLNHLLLYFRKEPETARKLFPSIYRSKHLLYDDEEIIDNISKAEELKDLLSDFNVKTTEEIRALLESARNSDTGLLPITQELLVSMGISNIDEWRKALEDQDLKALFAHNSIPTPDMFTIAQALIAKAKARVIAHLETLPEYDLFLMDDQTATTVLAGIVKEGRTISIVFRPAYDGQVIIYYGAERDTLDYVDSELWVDDGVEVRRISFGHILKRNNMRKFSI
jgi:DNA-directed RNA polymerase subunit F